MEHKIFSDEKHHNRSKSGHGLNQQRLVVNERTKMHFVRYCLPHCVDLIRGYGPPSTELRFTDLQHELLSFFLSLSLSFSLLFALFSLLLFLFRPRLFNKRGKKFFGKGSSYFIVVLIIFFVFIFKLVSGAGIQGCKIPNHLKFRSPNVKRVHA